MRAIALNAAGFAAALLSLSCEKRPPAAPVEDDEPPAVSAQAAGVLSSAYDLTATALGPNWIALAWTDNSGQETGFEIVRSTSGPTGPFSLLGIAVANSTSDADVSVSAAALYCYRVRAFRNVGKKTTFAEFSNTACARTPLLPPSSVNATPTSSSAISVSWNDNDPATGDSFRIERSGNAAGPWEAIATVGPSQTSHVDADRTSDEPVCYRLIAFNATGESSPSGTDCTSPPRAPSNLEAIAVGGGIAVSWRDNSAVEDVYVVERSDDGVTFGAIAVLSANTSVFDDVSTSSNTPYWYRVRARKDGGLSDASNVASAMRSCTASGPSEDMCADGIDNDCDDLIDAYDPDCGAPRCDWDQCPPGYVCDYEGFCVPHCGDGSQNGDEGDVDCGGSCSTKCQAGQHCWINWDCASGLCINSVCQPTGSGQ